MALQFNPPPDWLIQEYMNRKDTTQVAADGAQSVLQNYIALDQSNRKNALATQELATKNAEFELSKRKDAREQGQFARDYNPTELPGAGGAYNQFSTENYGQAGPALTPDAQMRSLLTQSGAQPTLASTLGQAPPPPQENAGPRRSPIMDFWSSSHGVGLAQNTQLAPGPTNAQEQANLEFANMYPQGRKASTEETVGTSLEQLLTKEVREGRMTLEQALEAKKNSQPPSLQFAGTQGGQPVLLNPKTGQMMTGKLPGQGPLMSTTQTEGQSNASLFAKRMEEADKQIGDLSRTVDLASFKSGAEGLAPNVVKSKEIQLYEQAKRNFLNAVLRRESGAVISPTEFADGNKQYFEVFGDSTEVKKQKALNRTTAIDGLRNAAGITPTSPSSGGGSAASGGGSAVAISSKAGYDALPPGSTYTWNGETRRKK